MTSSPPSSSSSGTQDSDAELLNRVACGDDRGMEMLYLRHSQLVHGFTRRQLRDDALVEDVVQEVFMAVFKNPSAFKGDSAFSTYLCSIAKLKAIDRLRQNKLERELVAEAVDDDDLAAIPDESDAADVLAQVGRQQTLAHIEACMDRLPVVQREAIFWTYFQDERDHEVAQRQNVSQGTVKSRLNAARQALKRCLAQRTRGDLHV